MPEMILYLLKVNIALLLFYAGYHFILQRYTFHTLNRFYLLTGLVYSALYPLIDLSKILNQNQQLTQQISLIAPDWQSPVSNIIIQAENSSGHYWQILLLIFWTGVLFMSIRLVIQLVSLLILHIQSRSFTLGNFKFRKISGAVNPFSFWRTIYLNPECHDAGELQSILEHEQVHVRQLHTADVLLAEISTIFYWFNPGVWLIKKAIKANLEYITDQEVIRSGVDTKEYQYTLLKTQVLPQNPMPVNNFHFLTIKKRIAMINKKPSSRINLGKYLLLPLVMLFMLVFGNSRASFNETKLVKAIENFTYSAKSIPSIAGPDDFTSAAVPTSIPDTVKPAVRKVTQRPDTNKLEIIQIRTSDDPYGAKTVIGSLTKPGIHGKEPIYIIDGVRTLKSAITIQSDSIATVNVYKVQGTATINNLKVDTDVIDIKSKSFNGPDEHPEKTLTTAYGRNQSKKPSVDSGQQGMLILDGKEIAIARFADLKPSDIESIYVLNGKTAVDQYGEKAKDGVVVVKMKKK